jgi:hypothetical protein
VHLEGDFDFITILKCAKVISKLFGVRMLFEERRNRSGLFAGLIARGLVRAIRRVGTRNILATNLVSIHCALDYIAYIKSIHINAGIRKAREGKEDTIGLFTTKADSTNISLVRVKVASDVVASIVLLTDEVVLFCELYGQLTVGGEIYTDFTFRIVGRYTDGITKYICEKQAVGIGVLTHIG